MKKLIIAISLLSVWGCSSAEQAGPCDSINYYLTEKMQPYMSHIRQVGWEDGSERVTFFLQYVYSDSLIDKIKANKKEWLLQTYMRGIEQGMLMKDSDNTYFWWPYDVDMLCLYLLDDVHYIELMKDAMDLYKQHKIDYTLFEAIVFPEPSLTTSIAKNYNNECVQELLEIILTDKHLSYILAHEGNPRAKHFLKSVKTFKNGELWNGRDHVHGIHEYSNIITPQLDAYKKQY